MKKGALSIIVGVFVFVALLAVFAGGLAAVSRITSGVQTAKVAQSQATIAHEERLQVEAEQEPEVIEEEWQGQIQYLLVWAQTQRDQELVDALIRLALADLNRAERSQAFTYTIWTLVILFLIGVIWWLAATKVVQ